ILYSCTSLAERRSGGAPGSMPAMLFAARSIAALGRSYESLLASIHWLRPQLGAITVVAQVGLLAHGGDLPVDQGFERPEQRIELRRRLQDIQRTDNRLDSRQSPRHRRLAQAITRLQPWRERDPRQRRQQRIAMQQFARLAPGAIGHYQQRRQLVQLRRELRQGLRLLPGKQQTGSITGLRQQRRQVLEALADSQLGVAQTQRRQTRGIQRMPDLARVLQDQHPGAARQLRGQRKNGRAAW